MSKIENVTFDSKRCGACVFWQGERTICQFEVSYDEGAVGKCNNPDSPAYSRGVPGIFNCYGKKDIN